MYNNYVQKSNIFYIYKSENIFSPYMLYIVRTTYYLNKELKKGIYKYFLKTIKRIYSI
ncbi:MAG: hypothetical protein ACRDAQ_12350 [Cetobacterium sp.]